ncbi:MAG: hypothetical protein RL701_3152 [Pseudomonadota bacterium]
MSVTASRIGWLLLVLSPGVWCCNRSAKRSDSAKSHVDASTSNAPAAGATADASVDGGAAVADSAVRALDAEVGQPIADASSQPSSDSGARPPPDASAGCDAAPPPGNEPVEARLGLGLTETPPDENLEDSIERVVTPEKKAIYEGRPQVTVFEGPTNRGTQAKLIFSLDKSIAIADLIGKKVELRKHWKMLVECETSGGPGTSPEPAVASQTTLRDAAGSLLVLAGTDTPTDNGGLVHTFPALGSEIALQWVALNPCPGSQAALEVVVNKTGARFKVTAGERHDLDLNGQRYVMAVASAFGPAAPGVCGHATWLVYRADFLQVTP